nr:regulator of telomere elongation helicase 1-like isoform X2 [Lytechinus pictus]
MPIIIIIIMFLTFFSHSHVYPQKENKFGGQSSSSSCSSITKRQRTACLVSAKDYVTEVKKRLSKENYKAFSNVMQSYKKDNDFGLMIAGLADLFTEDPTKYHLFRKFYSFVRPCHKKRFDQLCKEITGEGCGYRPEDSIEKKKTDDAEDKAQKPQAKRNMEPNTVGEAAKRHCSGLGSASSIATTSHLSSSSHLSKGADLLNGGADHLNKGTVHLNEGASLWTEGAESLEGS